MSESNNNPMLHGLFTESAVMKLMKENTNMDSA
jgi:hypothetical protein